MHSCLVVKLVRERILDVMPEGKPFTSSEVKDLYNKNPISGWGLLGTQQVYAHLKRLAKIGRLEAKGGSPKIYMKVCKDNKQSVRN